MVTQAIWWLFIALGPVLYWLLPPRARAAFLAAISIAFLGYFAPLDVAVMGALAAAMYGLLNKPDLLGGLAGRVAGSPFPVLAVVAYLFWSKYVPAFATAMGGQAKFLVFAVPLGVSYFAFKLIHYVIEHRWKKLPAHSFFDFLSYMFLMPIFTAGPIERFEHYVAGREDRFRKEQIVEGGIRIIIGLIKKFWIAVLVAELIQQVTGGDVTTLMAQVDTVSPLTIWAFLFLALVAIFLDFSAYSDIAIGASRLFGLRIMENFNRPYLSTNLRNFWLRWHMTLAHWCRSYIYMTVIGVTRNPYWAVLATFVVMGLWHAGWPAHWILWGVWHGVGSIVVLVWSRYAQRRKFAFVKGAPWAVASWAITMSYVALGGGFTAIYGHAPVGSSLQLIGRALALPV